MPAISVRGLDVTLGDHHVLQGLSFDVERGDTVCVIGPNGSGKTTLVKALLGLIPYRGSISVLGARPEERRARLGYVPQQVDFDRTMPLTVRDLSSIFADRRDRTVAHYRECLGQVGADHLLDRRIGELSGGEFQRVLLSLALHSRPELLILDEPAAGVDVEGEVVLYQMLSELKRRDGLTVMLVSHDLSVVYRYATTVLCLNHALVCQGRPQEVLTADTLGQLYGPAAVYHHPERPHPPLHA